MSVGRDPREDAGTPRMMLRGLVVAVTRGGDPDDPLEEMLERSGAKVVSWHTFSTAEPQDLDPLERALRDLEAYDWIAFTSARAVQAVTTRTSRPPQRGLVAAVGRGTERALLAAGWPVAVVGTGGARELVGTLSDAHQLEGARVLFPAASAAGSALQDGLTGLGARVDRVEAYQTVIAPPERTRVLEDLRHGVDVVTFASPSAVTSLAQTLGSEWPTAIDGGIAAIGPTTHAALVAAGVGPDRIQLADPPGFEGLVRAVAKIRATANAGALSRGSNA